MPALNFKPRFVEPIRSGTKHHTIRADRKIPVKAGDKLYLYCGLRHPGAFRILIEPVVCTKALPIQIRDVARGPGTAITREILIDDATLNADECEHLARADGFENFAEMMQFWDGRRPFKGQIIHWK